MMMRLSLLICFIAGASADWTLQNEHVRLEIGQEGSSTVRINFLGNTAPGSPTLIAAPDAVELWEAQFATPAGLVKRSSADATAAHVYQPSESELQVGWSTSIVVDGASVLFSVDLTLSLAPHARTITVRASVTNAATSTLRLGLWAFTLAVGGIAAADDDSAFYPNGFGVSVRGGLEGSNYYQQSPSGGASMQFLAAGGAASERGAGVYLGAHDGEAAYKILSWAVTNSTAETAAALRNGEGASAAMRNGSMDTMRTAGTAYGDGSNTCTPPLLRPTASMPSSRRYTRRFHTLAITTVVEGAGQPLSAWHSPYAFSIGVTPADGGPLWWGAAQLYRQWAVSVGESGHRTKLVHMPCPAPSTLPHLLTGCCVHGVHIYI